MSIAVNGRSSVPPGFRFHPTEEELLNYYLRKKVACEKIDLDVIRDVDLNKLEPWDIQEKCRIGSTPQNDWYFFSHKDKKYPTGTRTNRATAAGFWKATGRDKVIYTSCRRIGMRKTLVFYKGRAPHGQKSDWIMHEYRLDEHSDSHSFSNVSALIGETSNQEEGWVVCRVFKKKNLHKAMDSSNNSSSIVTDAKTHLLLHSSSDGTLDQILQAMSRSCKQEKESFITTTNNHLRYLRPLDTITSSNLNEMFLKLPALESPTISTTLADEISPSFEHSCLSETGLTEWAALDGLVAWQLNGQSTDSLKQLSCFDNPNFIYNNNNNNNNKSNDGGDGDLWSLASSASDRISHVSHGSI
ncbi:uncharacterized protein A4U43_C07F27000 [Asparagus officinalis]|uniref:NAC domain-containing protein n=1 Tax=Asparagus officinalis TaxID=4686 RepID=A0A5P1EF51_ASPOF|nr:NAC domain-containing protein 43-like [Asparagus officinalis]ONK64525.1 uncharacterized protein A4U43_C07F27000 [Asparagus officinalis]